MTNNIKEKVLNKFSDIYGCENWTTIELKCVSEFSQGYYAGLENVIYLIKPAKKELQELKEIEFECDRINANRGSQEKFCLFCLSDEYGKEGIKHREGCVLTRLRKRIKEIEDMIE